jgi:hypothetical protein
MVLSIPARSGAGRISSSPRRRSADKASLKHRSGYAVIPAPARGDANRPCHHGEQRHP